MTSQISGTSSASPGWGPDVIDPNDFLHVQIRIGSGLCQVLDQRGREVLACRRGNDRAAIRDLRQFIDQLVCERQQEQLHGRQ